jgi:rSAM/selenodomain-associated transferase 2
MSEISVIIPVFNEAAIIQEAIARLQKKAGIEIIVVDGGSQDGTVELVKEFGIKVILAPHVGRANQMNMGAAAATGKILLFLHADTQLPTGYLELIKQALATQKTIAGAFELSIAGKHICLRLIEVAVNWRSRFLSLPYGDQAIFINASTFQSMGGFANLPIMEDFEFVQRLKKKGKIAIVPAKAITSSRRWQKLGFLKTTIINQLMILGYYLGISPQKLANFYRSARSREPIDIK